MNLLWPRDNEEPEAAVSAEALYLGARMLRTIVYNAEHLRGEAARLFELAERDRHKAEEASVDA